MTEELLRALRLYSQYRDTIRGCPDEPDFDKLFPVLGDREAQDAIREANQDVVHCDLLLTSPNACLGCPKNPRRNDKGGEVKEGVDEHSGLLNAAFRFLEDYEYGVLEMSTLLPWEFQIVLIMRDYEEMNRQQLAAQMIRSEIGKLFGSESKQNG